ncbi:DUF2089 family protein [Fulvivirgaceae bacterium BMA10]|uniref:DUF2089 family protein n=1 Tax=Splendidivirga corallicola TaxID=3051826 RepID=A0ABT8KHB4_9BACT|nr:DUF2089 family protein [Fulvivirgaceae bacterium BMA10]
MTIKKLPVICPSCSGKLKVQSLHCEACETTVSGLYSLPILSNLSNEEQTFILDFVKNSGSLKTMAQKLGLSYPTVRNRLDDIIEKIRNIESEEDHH